MSQRFHGQNGANPTIRKVLRLWSFTEVGYASRVFAKDTWQIDLSGNMGHIVRHGAECVQQLSTKGTPLRT